jgi:hypothetical protein
MESCPPETMAQPALSAVVNEVLGNLAFLIGEDEPHETAAAGEWLEFSISYCGPRAGTLRCWCTPKLARQLAANLLGTEPQAGEAEAAAVDACREFINVLCGQLVTAWYGRQAVFTLTIPTVETGVGARLPQQLGPECCRIEVGGEPLVCQHVAHGGGLAPGPESK